MQIYASPTASPLILREARSQGPRIFSRWPPLSHSLLKVFTARFYYVSHGNSLITCYEGNFRELGAIQLSPLANRKPLRYENKPRAGASSMVACPVLTELRKMFYNRVQCGQKKRAERMERTNWQTLQKKSTTRNTA